MSAMNNADTEDFSLKDLLKPYLTKWYWIVVGIFICLTLSYLYLRYTPLQYETRASILIKESGDNGLTSDLAPFSSLGLFTNYNKGQLENELVILRSRRIISEVIKSLDLNTMYEREGLLLTSELYPQESRPFKVTFFEIEGENTRNFKPFKFRVILKSDVAFEIETIDGSSLGTFNFGDKVTLPFAEFMITPSPKASEMDMFKPDNAFIITYFNTVDLAIGFQSKIKISNDIQNSNVISLSMESKNKKKTEAFINELVRQFNLDAINDQNLIVEKTAEFIDSRLEIITKDLDSVEQNREDFKTRNRLTDIGAEAQLVLEGATEYSNKQIDYETQIEIIESIIEYLGEEDDYSLIPANLGLQSQEVTISIDTYNQLILERNRLLNNSTEANPVIVNIDSQINGLRGSILESLNNQLSGLRVVLRELNKKENKFNSRLSQVPSQEKLFRNIVRQQEIKEQLYIFLLKQREETSIKLASASSKAKVIDPAYSSKGPISPKKNIVYIAGFVLGIIFPVILIYILTLLNTHVQNRKDVERELKNLSLVGEIPLIKSNADQIIRSNDKSILAESFRILRTNLQYFFIKEMDLHKSKTILITSTIKGEGKTLVAFNLALTLSYSGKKVALVGADIRNPQLQRYLPKSLSKHAGLTEYLVDDSMTIDDVTLKSDYKDLDIVLSGAIPPNPAELLMQNRTENFFKELDEKYDFVIVDTAPSMLVTDTLLINKYGDVTLYVIKANYTDKKLLQFPKEIIGDGRLKNVALVLNGVTMNNFGYGNKYGYTYDQTKKSKFGSMFGLK